MTNNLEQRMNVLFISSGNSKVFNIQPFIKSQGESLRRKGINLEYFQVKGKGLVGYTKNIKKIKRTIRDKDIDIVHSHYSLTGWVAYFAACSESRVLSLMGSDTHGGSTRKSTKWLMNIQLFLIQFLYPKIIVKSRNLSNVLWASKKTEIIPNGVNFDVFKPIDKELVRKKLGLKNNIKYVLFMANPKDQNKNYRLLTEAMEKVQTKEAVILSPFPVKHNETMLYYNACDVMVFPSLKEGSPNVIKEAIACNTNIIATPSGDVVERTKGLKNVLICEYDAIIMAKQIDYFLQNNVKYNARAEVREQIDEDLIADRIINIYKSLLN